MASIFADATITIVAEQGEDANYGLRGLRNISHPRNYAQKVFSWENGSKIVVTSSKQPNSSLWSQRGWTFQEDYFSSRKIVFDQDFVEWKCRCIKWTEDTMVNPFSSPGRFIQSDQVLFTHSLPDILAYHYLIHNLQSKKFTYPEDVSRSFSSISSALSRNFKGGFLYGHPLLFFDTMLLWRTTCSMSKRRNPNQFVTGDKYLPSWSWMGWGNGIFYNLNIGSEYIKCISERFPDRPWCVREITVPIVDWYSHRDATSTGTPIPNDWNRYRSILDTAEVPPGWTRHRSDLMVDFDYNGSHSSSDSSYPDRSQTPRYFYKHESDSTSEFWYPIP